MAFGTIQNKKPQALGYLASDIDARGNAGKGVDDTKKSRQEIVEKANLILNSLLATMGSTYVSENAFSDYAIQLKSVSFEAARIIVTGQDVYNDLIFATTRPEFFYQNIETFLFLNRSFPFSDKSDVAIRTFLLALIKAYFTGARKISIETALTLALENQATFFLTENFLEARTNPFPPLPVGTLPALDFVPRQHTFKVDINLINSVADVQAIQRNVFFLVNLIKPAHTWLELRFIFTEDAGGGFSGVECTVEKDEFGNPIITPDGFETVTKNKQNQICDTFHMKIFQYQYEDFRHDCEKNLNVEVIGELASLIDSTKIKTRYGPIGNGEGSLASSVTDVQVFVDNIQVEVFGIDALKGIVTLLNPIPNGSTVTINYSYLRKHFQYLQTNDSALLINQFEDFGDTLPSFSFSSVLWSPNDNDFEDENIEKHFKCKFKYQGFDALNSSLLNNPLTLQYNKVSSRDKLNDSWEFRSEDYDFEYFAELNYPTQPFVGRQELSLVIPDDSKNIFYLNDVESLMNTLSSSIIGGTIFHKLMHNGNKVYNDEIDKVYASLEYEAECEGVSDSKLKPFCESALDFIFDFSNADPDSYGGIKPEIDNEFLVTNGTGFVLNDFVLYLPRVGNFPGPGDENFTYHRIDIHDYLSDFFFTPIQEVFGQVTDMTWFEHDFKGNFYDYILNTIPDELLNDPMQLLPPLPGFDIGESLHMDMVFEGGPGEGYPGPPAFADTFIKHHKFLMNHLDSMLNTNENCSIISVRPMNPLCDGSYISDYLKEFSLTTPVTGIFDTDGYGPSFPENPPVPFTDSFLYVLTEPDFTVSGFFNEVDAVAFDITALDTVPSFTDSLTGMAITKTFQDGLFHGYVVLYPYFLANFTPIFDHLWASSLVMGGDSITGAGSGMFTEIMPLPEETDLDILLA